MDKMGIHATADGGLIRIQAWSGGISEVGVTNSITLTPEEAARLVDKINAAISELPRIGTAADLGCEAMS